MKLTIGQACDVLRGLEDVLIIAHQSPDGDTIGSAFALCKILERMGKRAMVDCSDPIPQKYSYITREYHPPEFEPQSVIAVDIADEKLMGRKFYRYKDRIDLCIDHHPSNTGFAKNLYLDEQAAATAEIICDIARELGLEVDKYLAKCIYTGMVTDTGCFRYANTTPKLLRMAADMLETGIEAFMLNRILLELKTPQRMMLDKMVLESLEFFHDNQLAIVSITLDMVEKSGASEDDLDGITMLTRQIAGTRMGMSLREKEDGTIRVSVRSSQGVNASKFCAYFGGGGHLRAAGCLIRGSLEDVKKVLIQAAEPYLSTDRTAFNEQDVV